MGNNLATGLLALRCLKMLVGLLPADHRNARGSGARLERGFRIFFCVYLIYLFKRRVHVTHGSSLRVRGYFCMLLLVDAAGLGGFGHRQRVQEPGACQHRL